MHDIVGFQTEAERKFQLLEELMKAMKGQGVFGMDVADMSLVPGIIVPAKFKAPDFDK